MHRRLTEEGEFEGRPVIRRGPLDDIDDALHIHAEGIDVAAEEALGGRSTGVPVQAPGGIRQASLTVHPIGNWGKAEYGGRGNAHLGGAGPDLIAPAHQGRGEGYAHGVFEVTHHALCPAHAVPETGSDERA